MNLSSVPTCTLWKMHYADMSNQAVCEEIARRDADLKFFRELRDVQPSQVAYRGEFLPPSQEVMQRRLATGLPAY